METYKEWLTAKEVAELTGVTVNRVYNWIKEGRVPPEYYKYIKQGFRRRVFFKKEFVESLSKEE